MFSNSSAILFYGKKLCSKFLRKLSPNGKSVFFPEVSAHLRDAARDRQVSAGPQVADGQGQGENTGCMSTSPRCASRPARVPPSPRPRGCLASSLSSHASVSTNLKNYWLFETS